MQFERNNKLIISKFWQYLIPTVLSVFASNMALVVDSVIVSSLIGVDALSGLQILFPLIAFIDLLCWMVGLGGSLICASAKADFNEKRANSIFSVSLISMLFISIILTVIGLLFPETVIGWLSNSVHPNLYALEYFRMYILGVPFCCFMLSIFYFIGTDGMPEFTSKALIIASILDPLFDVILIYFFHMGIAGSGLATTFSYIGGSLIMALYFFKPNRTLKIVKVKLSSIVRGFANICKTGFGGASTQLYITITALIYNSIIIAMVGNIGLISQEICTDMLLIISILFMGLVETISPLISVYYTDCDYSAIEHIKTISFRFLLIISVIFTAIMVFFPDIIMIVYSVKSQYYPFVSNVLRIYGLYFLPLGFVFFYIFYTQAINKIKLSNIVSLFFNMILVIVMLMILPKIFGGNGIWATPFCAGAITIFGIVIYSRYITRKSGNEYHGVFINKSPNDNFWEFSIGGNKEDVDGFVSMLRSKFTNNQLIDSACSSLEEFLKYVVETNDGIDAIDIILDVDDDSIKINIKDLGNVRNGEFAFINDVDFNRKFNQTEVLGLNSTLITINR